MSRNEILNIRVNPEYFQLRGFAFVTPWK
jgi:hypothetical protein